MDIFNFQYITDYLYIQCRKEEKGRKGRKKKKKEKERKDMR